MATSFREWPWPLQAVFYVALAFVVVALGFYLPISPVRTVRSDLEAAQNTVKPLEAEVQSLRVYKQRRAELQSEMDALQKQLETLQTIVPEEKQVDQFILMIQSAALSSGVSIRKLTAKPVATQPYYFEMPFDIEADGPYFAVLDFFGRLGRLSRIINVGDLKLSGLGGSTAQAPKWHTAPGASVTGTMTITTFFTKAADVPAATTTAAPVNKAAAGQKR
jgi:type IV pilus assembly protein PilO